MYKEINKISSLSEIDSEEQCGTHFNDRYGKYGNVKFVHVPELENLEWVEGCFNTAFNGEPTNAPALRKYMLNKIAELDIWQLLTLWGGTDYDTASGNDVGDDNRTILRGVRYDFMGAVKDVA